ncbi:CHAT domain-containing protein [Acrocarpospora phusangensis]|uniref:CHAT domain-containing protein n=1 Tax=Acrocarpospora phusangensis TaxID=1070424 RepID=A0A919USF8_9ACTN|nr:CHAT domain-containing tetratricopeptide repeat protein [Acrocarpospora phusangensis]GIH26405.1 CHAT domain-containing protein [Acrocarpospora phusangensis]
MTTTTRDPSRTALALAEADPERAVAFASALVRQARAARDPLTESSARRAMGIAAVHRNHLVTASRHLNAAIRVAERAGSRELAVEARLRLAFVTSVGGRPQQALREIEELMPGLHGVLRARAEAQRAAVFNHLGRRADALACYRAAVPALRRAQDHLWLQRVLSNRGIMHGYRQEFAAAETDFREAEALCRELGLDLSLAIVWMNLGWVMGARGDVPAALRYFDQAEARFRALGTHQLGWLLTDRAELLLSVGLVAEARAAAEEAVAELERLRRAILLPEVRLLLARAATMAGDHDGALRAARRAVREFAAQQRPEWRVLASFVVVRSRLAAGHRGIPVRRLETLADDLDAAGWTAAGVETRLLGARLAQARGQAERGRALLARAARARGRGPALLRVRAWQAEALLRLSAGNRPGAAGAVRTALRVLDEHRASLGATDLRAYSSGFRVELAELGLRMAFDQGVAGRVLAWAEQGRASHLLMKRARPPGDPWLAGALAELRATASDLGSSRNPKVVQRQAVLEREIRDYSRRREGAAGAPGGAAGPPGVARLAEPLGEQVLVEYVQLDGVLHAVTVAGGRARLRALGPLAPIRDLVERLPFALRRLARAEGAAASGASAAEAAAAMVRHAAARLDALLLAPLAAEVGDRPLVVIPTGPLQFLPWSVLPSCAGRQVSVAPSAGMWHTASLAERGGGHVAAVAGPGLPGGNEEVAAVAALHATKALTGDDATAEAALSALDGARLAHLAAHGRVNLTNPLFSALRLADGPLTVYDLERLAEPPRLVILAACESGRSVVRAGDELLGLSATFLSLGTRCIIASLVPVPDAQTAPMMVALHRQLAEGRSAADALARAQERAGGVAAAGFVCLGAGSTTLG